MSSVSRMSCPRCGAPCIEQETACWQCGTPLHVPLEPEPAPSLAEPQKPAPSPLIEFDEYALAPIPSQSSPHADHGPVLLGEEPDDADAPGAPWVRADDLPAVQPATPAAPPADAPIVGGLPHAVMRLTFCKACGQQNDEGANECRKCGKLLEIVQAGSVPDVVPLPRAWGFDVLGIVWMALGLSAAYCGWFLVKVDPSHPGVQWSDLLWTGLVAGAPGVLIIIRHPLCRLMFWVMTFAGVAVWLVIGFLWYFVGLHITENGQVGLDWLAALSLLTFVSYLTVRQNDAFD